MNNLSHNENDFWRWCSLCKDYFIVGKHDHESHERKMVYNEYLQSRAWAFTKWLRKDCKCAECESRTNLQLHHDTYSWHNRNKLLRWILPNMSDEMRTLCQYHHELAHKKG